MLIVDCDSKHKIVLDYFGDEEDCTKLHEELKRNSNIGYYFAWTDNSNVDARMVNCEIMPLAIANENVYLNPVAFAKAGKNELRALCNARPQYYREEVIENLVSSHVNPALDEKAAPIALANVIENISLSLFDAKDIQVLPSFRDGEVNLKVGDKDLVGKVKFGIGIGDNSVSINSSMYLELKEKEGEVSLKNKGLENNKQIPKNDKLINTKKEEKDITKNKNDSKKDILNHSFGLPHIYIFFNLF